MNLKHTISYMVKEYYISLALVLALALTLTSCRSEIDSKEQNSVTEVKKAWEALYEHYSNSDMRFIDYYQDDVLRMGTDGEYKVGKAVFKKGWENHYKENYVKLLDYSQPTILESEDQSVTFNTYEELFINKQTQDTTHVEGTWIAIWKKQDDGSWKIRMSTWHNVPDQENNNEE